jgi:hypothetical protein
VIWSDADHQTTALLPDMQPWNQPEDWNWKTDVTMSETTVGGHPATLTRFTTNCPEPDISGFDWCLFDDEALSEEADGLIDGEELALVVVHLPGGPFTIVVRDEASTFDTYWADVALPILDSIEFLDS